MMSLAERIATTQVEPGTVAIFYLAQAGFALKTSAGKTVVIDPYLSDSVNRLFGFKRMIPAVISSEELAPDVMLITHSHADHLDVDAVPVIARNGKSFFVGAPDCAKGFAQCGVTEGRMALLGEDEEITVEGINIRATYADHADLAPEAVGFVIDVDGLTIYNVGDSGPAYDKIAASVCKPIDVMIAPINGAFGNLDASQAVELAKVMKPKVVIASHFWMFIEHGGDPAKFLEEAKALGSETQAVVMAPGESMVIRSEKSKG
jgi:L-ascorbate 6-phosphate lactonase